MKKRVYSGALLFGFLLFGYWIQLEPPLSDDDLESRLESIVADSFLDTRFDFVSVDIGNGVLVIKLEDTEICSNTDGITRITKNINLRDFNAVRRSGFGAVDIIDELSQVPIFVRVLMELDARNRISIISARKDQILSAARTELGRGQEASNRTYELFTQSTPNLETLSYEVRENCTGGIGLNLVQTSFALKIKSVNAEEYIRLLNQVIDRHDD